MLANGSSYGNGQNLMVAEKRIREAPLPWKFIRPVPASA